MLGPNPPYRNRKMYCSWLRGLQGRVERTWSLPVFPLLCFRLGRLTSAESITEDSGFPAARSQQEALSGDLGAGGEMAGVFTPLSFFNHT